jgi:hypothetical protein
MPAPSISFSAQQPSSYAKSDATSFAIRNVDFSGIPERAFTVCEIGDGTLVSGIQVDWDGSMGTGLSGQTAGTNETQAQPTTLMRLEFHAEGDEVQGGQIKRSTDLFKHQQIQVIEKVRPRVSEPVASQLDRTCDAILESQEDYHAEIKKAFKLETPDDEYSSDIMASLAAHQEGLKCHFDKLKRLAKAIEKVNPPALSKSDVIQLTLFAKRTA